MEEIKLTMKGPYNLIGNENLFNSPDNKFSGIYFFTFKIQNKNLIEYVGITTKSFEERFTQHLGQLLSGGYKLYDFQNLNDGKSFVVWEGRYNKEKDNITVFLDNYLKFSQIIEQQLQELKIFLIPLDTDKRILERIEDKIFQILKEKKDERINTFIKGVKTCPKRDNEKPMKVQIILNFLYPDIPNDFEI